MTMIWIITLLHTPLYHNAGQVRSSITIVYTGDLQ